MSTSREKCFACLYFLLRIHNGKQRPAGKWPPRQSSVPQCNSVHNISVVTFISLIHSGQQGGDQCDRDFIIFIEQIGALNFWPVDAERQMWCCSLDRVACFHVDSKRM